MESNIFTRALILLSESLCKHSEPHSIHFSIVNWKGNWREWKRHGERERDLNSVLSLSNKIWAQKHTEHCDCVIYQFCTMVRMQRK